MVWRIWRKELTVADTPCMYTLGLPAFFFRAVRYWEFQDCVRSGGYHPQVSQRGLATGELITRLKASKKSSEDSTPEQTLSLRARTLDWRANSVVKDSCCKRFRFDSHGHPQGGAPSPSGTKHVCGTQMSTHVKHSYTHQYPYNIKK